MNSVWKGKVKVAPPDIDHKCYYSLKKFKEEWSWAPGVVRERFVKVTGIELGLYSISLVFFLGVKYSFEYGG